jgi:hypothetical protein
MCEWKVGWTDWRGVRWSLVDTAALDVNVAVNPSSEVGSL